MKQSLSPHERQRLDDDGYVAIEGVVSARQLEAMRERLEALLAVTPQDHAGTLIVAGLFTEEVFDAAWSHPRVLAAMEHVLGERYRLMGVASRGLRPGHGQQALHTDWADQGVAGVWYICHAICALVDFTEENGATRVVPGSHRAPWMIKGHRDLRQRHPMQRQLVGEAGTIFILNVHCLHSAVHNGSSEPRLAIFSSFSRRDSPLLDLTLVPNPDQALLERHSAEIRALLTS